MDQLDREPARRVGEQPLVVAEADLLVVVVGKVEQRLGHRRLGGRERRRRQLAGKFEHGGPGEGGRFLGRRAHRPEDRRDRQGGCCAEKAASVHTIAYLDSSPAANANEPRTAAILAVRSGMILALPPRAGCPDLSIPPPFPAALSGVSQFRSADMRVFLARFFRKWGRGATLAARPLGARPPVTPAGHRGAPHHPRNPRRNLSRGCRGGGAGQPPLLVQGP